MILSGYSPLFSEEAITHNRRSSTVPEKIEKLILVQLSKYSSYLLHIFSVLFSSFLSVISLFLSRERPPPFVVKKYLVLIFINHNINTTDNHQQYSHFTLYTLFFVMMLFKKQTRYKYKPLEMIDGIYREGEDGSLLMGNLFGFWLQLSWILPF